MGFHWHNKWLHNYHFCFFHFSILSNSSTFDQKEKKTIDYEYTKHHVAASFPDKTNSNLFFWMNENVLHDSKVSNQRTSCVLVFADWSQGRGWLRSVGLRGVTVEKTAQLSTSAPNGGNNANAISWRRHRHTHVNTTVTETQLVSQSEFVTFYKKKRLAIHKNT